VLRGFTRLIVVTLLALVFASAAAAGWAGSDPPRNFPLGKLPYACERARTGRTCIDAGVYYLDRARAQLGEPAYALPADFALLTPAEQMFILTNLDRIQYGLPPMTGLTAALDDDAYTTGVKPAADPYPTDTSGEINGYTANWAGAFDNAPMAYEAWMYDDGLGSGNVDCTSSHRSGCCGHRHDVLWTFDPSDVLAMGGAAGRGPYGQSYALLLVAGFPADPASGDPGWTPDYSYTWSQAVADGAGSNVYDPGVPNTAVCVVPAVVGKTVTKASRAIRAAHCGEGAILRRDSVYRKGVVFRQSPEPTGHPLAPGTKVKLLVSAGRRR
jgi:hypothetical protein